MKLAGIRPSVPLCAIVLGICSAGCGSGGGANSTAPSAATGSTSTVQTAASSAPSTEAQPTPKSHKSSSGAPAGGASTGDVRDSGHAASATDRSAIAALLERYYTAAAAGDGAKACSMLYITLAEAVPEDYGHGSAGPSYLSRGTTCPAVMELLFKHYHSRLVADLPRLEVKRVVLIHHHGLAFLSFGRPPEHEIGVRRQARAWKITSLLDSEAR